jgi:hypothetical protein
MKPFHACWHIFAETISTARLIARIIGVPDGDPAARIRALLLISSALAFQSGRRIVLRTMRWATIWPEELAMVLADLDAQIDAIGRDLPMLHLAQSPE